MNWFSIRTLSNGLAKITGLTVGCILISCNPTQESDCALDARYEFNFEQAQYYALPVIDFSFNLSKDWKVRMPEFAKQNFYYYQCARVNDDSTGSVLLTIKPFKRQGAYISVQEQVGALINFSTQKEVKDSWITEIKDTVDGWWLQYGRYEQEPKDYVIAHKLIMPDSLKNSLLLQLQMDCEPGKFDTKNERCFDEVERSINIYL